jgi:hypothetical protein
MSNFWWRPPDEAAEIFITGDDFSGTLPRSGSYEWYSDAEAWAWRSFYQTFNIPAGGANHANHILASHYDLIVQ